jgi:hypothetical protein
VKPIQTLCLNELEHTPPPLRRWHIYRTRASRGALCVVAARTRESAITTARSMFTLGRDAHAIPETWEQLASTARNLSIAL